MLSTSIGAFWIAATLFVVARAVSEDNGQFAIVQTENGPLKGERRGQFYAFEGIPYAKAPVGKLRLAPSELNDERWEESRDATKLGAECVQWNQLVEDDDKLLGEEDCLFLNIYTRSLPEEDAEPLPIIFSIHGGSLMYGSSNFYQVDNLMKNELVVVTINYRVGPLGFLSTEDDVIPGNLGLKDQVTALKWVRRNVANFGGHVDNITITGCSAGSVCVHMHYLSPLSRGLFKNGIGHSGAALNPWAMAENSAEKAKRIAATVGCPTKSSEEILSCLRKKPARDIVMAAAQFFDFLNNPFSPLGVVIEKQSPKNPKPFLTEHPYRLMERGDFYQVPLILSLTEAEGLYGGAKFISKQEYLDEINNDWDRVLPSVLDYRTVLRNDESRSNEISQLIRKRYMGDRLVSGESFRDFIKIISNRLYIAGLIRSAQLMQPYTPVYLFHNLYKSQFGIGELLSKSMTNYGVAHGEDILLIFKTELRDAIPYSEEELLVAGRFVDMYERFARESVAAFGPYAIPRMDQKDKVRYLELNYPKSEEKLTRELCDEQFWYQIDFNEGMPVEERPVKSEL